MNNEEKSLIVSIVVTYQPNISKLRDLIDSLCTQTDQVIIIDNASGNVDDLPSLRNKVTLICLEHNYGIAYAQNVGIKQAVEKKCSHILLMDQDSMPADNMVEELKKGFIYNDIIAVGPAYIDARSNEKSFFVTERSGLPHRLPNSTTQRFVEAAFLISSGSLINSSKLIIVKGKRSNYFIDHVDTEWTIRARNYGYKLVGACNAIMYHSLGDQVKKVWFFGSRQISYHTPLRDYYMFRNTLLMLRDVNMSWFWKAHFIWRLFQFAGYFLVFSTDKKERLAKMMLGLWHGLKNIRGKLQTHSNSCSVIPKTTIEP